mmetsp:Transcript_15623/g.43697  ORF Transcript_15623/g.43697 Transcript_15623/m.43697 type:complete len:102 (+) Transcript_15623:201-506(+)|eukprot:CAMPEP_0117664658 /NCGR_PEP_ID=MMETSP0804-20121206/9351_1 /TAXON_ID=1074897 /ORGANISM="Tetraselmis astigmatica, Strain CCMP880" /LENGTH=101 /DNA_ID=CAMNT_0005471933 /DNA_START=199 /DNA_END=504 /DNA_ORIENTATION=-
MDKSSGSRAEEAAASVARSAHHEAKIKGCMQEAAEAGAKGFVLTGLASTTAVLGAMYASPWFRRYLGPSGKTAIAFTPALFVGFLHGEQQMTECTRRTVHN